LNNIGHIASGSYGAVYKFASPDGDAQFAVKIMNLDDAEYNIVRSITSTTGGRLMDGDACALINAVAGNMNIKYSDYPEFRKIDARSAGLNPYAPLVTNKNITVMNLMSGNVSDLIDKLGRAITIDTVLGIAKILFENAICFSRMGYVYSDYKGMNLLYRCEDRGVARITYSDIGGLVAKVNRDIYMTCTMPPPEIYRGGSYGNSKPNDAIMVWGCAVCMVESFLHVNRETKPLLRKLTHIAMSSIPNYNTIVRGIVEYRDRFIEHGQYDRVLLKPSTSLGDFFRGTLEPNPASRWSLRQALDTLG